MQLLPVLKRAGRSSCAVTPRLAGGKCTRSAGDGHAKAKCTLCPRGRPAGEGIVDSAGAKAGIGNFLPAYYRESRG